MSIALDRILSHFPDARKSGKGFEAHCPSHDDRKPSLSIGEGDDGRVLIHCQQGCPPDRVLAALGLSLRDLWSDPLVSIGVKVEKIHLTPNGNGVALKSPQKGRIVATYPYVDETGNLLYEVVRWNPKDFRQRRPDGRGGWVWTIDDVRRVLYRLPQLQNADPSRPVFLSEGEKDVHSLEAHGYVATTSAQGAKSWSLGGGVYEQQLKGRDVVIVPHNDEGGEKYAAEVASSLSGFARSCRIVRLPGLSPHGDISDWFDLGHTTEELDELVGARPDVAPVRYIIHTMDETLTEPEPIDWIVETIFSVGSVSLVVGAPGTKKTWLLLDCAVCVAMGYNWLGYGTTQCPVLLVDEESGPHRLNRRMGDIRRGHRLGAGVPVAWITMAAFNLGTPVDIAHLCNAIETYKPRLVMVDALADVMPGRDENAVKDTQPVFQALRAIAEKYQIAIVLIHHENKIGGYRGSTAIKAAVDLMLVVKSEPKSPIVEVQTEKARDVEPFSFAAMLSWDDIEKSVRFTSTKPAPVHASVTTSQQYVLRYLGEHGGRAYLDEIVGAADVCAPVSAKRAVYELTQKGTLRRCDKGAVGTRALYEVVSETKNG